MFYFLVDDGLFMLIIGCKEIARKLDKGSINFLRVLFVFINLLAFFTMVATGMVIEGEHI